MAATDRTDALAGDAAKPFARAEVYYGVVFAALALVLLFRNALPAWAVAWPEAWQLPIADGINLVVDFLRNDLSFGLFTFKEFTRAIAWLVSWPLDWMTMLLQGGFKKLGVPPVPWVLLVGLAAVWGYYLKGWRLALLAGGCFLYLALFGQWDRAMRTLAMVLVAMPLAGLLGLGLGILAVRRPRFEIVLWPVLNVMQSLPHFSYLIPVAVFIGVGQEAGAIATMLFAMPPMARLTILGLRGVSPEVIEAGTMAGCTPRQSLWKVQIPAARPSLMIGVNQVIMQCLAMVVIAAFIGAKGLGFDLLFRLQSLRIGQALEIGVAIVLMAIALDRLSQALAAKEPAHTEATTLWGRHPYLIVAAGVVVLSIVAMWLAPWAAKLPKSMTITTAPFWDAIVDYVATNFFDALALLRDNLLREVLIPLKRAFGWIPWVVYLAAVGAIGWALGRTRLALIPVGFLLFILLSGYWPRAMITLYMVTFAVFVCVIIGVPIGLWAARRDWSARLGQVLCDTFQTFPSFIYLIPVIMLFRVGDVAAITAIVVYAIIPAVRYTIFGIRNVPHALIEAAITSGCTRRQVLWKVQLPLAFPEIMLGINQTIMFALFMVIIAAFIGTTDLGQEIFRSLTFNDAGKGLVVGLCVAFLGLTADRLITAWASERKRQLGLA